jgi:hypothetical protein
MTTDLLDQIPHHCHILEAADDSFRFKASGEAIKRERNWQYRAPILHKGEKSRNCSPHLRFRREFVIVLPSQKTVYTTTGLSIQGWHAPADRPFRDEPRREGCADPLAASSCGAA